MKKDGKTTWPDQWNDVANLIGWLRFMVGFGQFLLLGIQSKIEMKIFFLSGNKASFDVVFRWSASMMRESSYSTIRLGAYEPLKWQFGATDPAHPPLTKKLVAGATSGWF